MNIPLLLAIGGGGACGALARHGLNTWLTAVMGHGFPWGIMTVNILGSFVMGVLIALFAHVWQPAEAVRAFATVGLLGAFTTFSTFSLQAVRLFESGQFAQAGFYIAGSVAGGIAALVVGMVIVRGLAA